jgi:hypothetical protein
MENFNAAEGIEHIKVPAYSQEFNSIVERALGTLLGSTRTCLIHSQAPERAYGECFVALCFALNRILHRSGGRLSRLEKFKGKLLPDQRKHLQPWGCAAYVHLDHGVRGHVGGVGRAPKNPTAAKARLGFLCGYEAHGLGWRICMLPDMRIIETPHVRFEPTHFPCRTELVRELGAPLLTESTPFYDYDTPDGDALSSRGRPTDDLEDSELRPQRVRQMSARALENLPDVDQAPTASVSVTIQDEEAFVEATELIYKAEGGDSTTNRLQGPDKEGFVQALIAEYLQHVKNGTLGPAISKEDVPQGHKPIPLDILSGVKRDGRKKMRAIIKGYRMTEGLDYNETFSPVPCITSIRTFLALAVQEGWEIDQNDVHTAFLACDMDTELYVLVPRWFCDEPFDSNGQLKQGWTIHRMYRAIPGVPQGPRLWNNKRKEVFVDKLGFVQSKAEICLFFCPKRKLYCFGWVDDFFLFYPPESRAHRDKFWTDISKLMDLSAPSTLYDCLGCRVTRDKRAGLMWLGQQNMIEGLLSKNNLLQDSKMTITTPLTPGVKLSKQDCPSAEQAQVMSDMQKWYRSTVASLIYLANWTRPDLSYAVSKLCRFMHNPGEVHAAELKRALRYLRRTSEYGLLFRAAPDDGAFKVNGYFDAAHADCPDTLRSTMAYMFYVGSSLVSWNTKLHSFVTTSTNHSEFCCSAKASREAKWFDSFMREVGFADLVGPISLLSDSQGAISMTYNPVHRAATKHIALADHYTREMQQEGVTAVSYTNTKDMRADMLTKSLGRADFERHASTFLAKIGECP